MDFVLRTFSVALDILLWSLGLFGEHSVLFVGIGVLCLTARALHIIWGKQISTGILVLLQMIAPLAQWVLTVAIFEEGRSGFWGSFRDAFWITILPSLWKPPLSAGWHTLKESWGAFIAHGILLAAFFYGAKFFVGLLTGSRRFVQLVSQNPDADPDDVPFIELLRLVFETLLLTPLVIIYFYGMFKFL